MTITEASILSVEIVDKIRLDFTDRRGLRQEWEQIDEEVRAEILEKWMHIVMECLIPEPSK